MPCIIGGDTAPILEPMLETGTGCSTKVLYSARTTSRQAPVSPPTTLGVVRMV